MNSGTSYHGNWPSTSIEILIKTTVTVNHKFTFVNINGSYIK
jgi:hypothetical protein